jgi:hypothetical protein
VAAERLEQLEHPLVGRLPLAGEGVRDEARQVVVADADRVTVAERTDRDLGRRPRSDPGIARSLRYASGRGIATISSNRFALAATARTRSARRRSSPSGWNA